MIVARWRWARWAACAGRTSSASTPQTGRVAVYQGVPFDIDNSHRLYRLVSRSSVVAASLPRSERAQALFDHKLRSSSDAERILRQLQATEP